MKTALRKSFHQVNWLLDAKAQEPSAHQREYFVLVAVPGDLQKSIRNFIVPRSHVAAAAWIEHMNWLTDPHVPKGKRKAPVEQDRVKVSTFARYENRWDLLFVDEGEAPVLLPTEYRALAQEERVGLPPGHAWHSALPLW